MVNDETLKAQLQTALSECQRLRDENAELRRSIHQVPGTSATPRLNHLLPKRDSHESTWCAVTNDSQPQAKIDLFKGLFRGREDVYAVRWEGKSGKTGYAPAGIREWDRTASTGSRKPSFHYTKLFSISD